MMAYREAVCIFSASDHPLHAGYGKGGSLTSLCLGARPSDPSVDSHVVFPQCRIRRIFEIQKILFKGLIVSTIDEPWDLRNDTNPKRPCVLVPGPLPLLKVADGVEEQRSG